MTDVKVTFLGTGASHCVYRTHTAIVLDCPDGTRLLLDTGSGTSVIRQGAAMGMAAESFDRVLLSHHHADHMGGVPYIQNYRTFANPEGPPMRVYSTEEALEATRRFCQATRPLAITADQDGIRSANGRQVLRWNPAETGEWVELGPTTRAAAFPVDHISGAVGWRVEANGVPVVFSGDTRLSPDLVEAAQGARLLIHEALSTERDAEDTHARLHSTAAAAGRAAALAGVAELVITHIDTPFHFDAQPLVDEAKRLFDGPITAAHELYQMTAGPR